MIDVHVSDTLEYGLTQEDGSFTYSVNGDCTMDESGKITNPDYVLAYVHAFKFTRGRLII